MKIAAETIEALWPFSNVVVGEPLQWRENGRTLVRFDAAEGRFLYRVADPSKARSLDRELQAFGFLPRRGFASIPRLVPARSGALFEEMAGRRVYALEFVEGDHPAATPETYAVLGRLTADLHGIEGYPHRSEFDVDLIAEHDLSHRAEGLPFAAEFMDIARSLPRFGHLPSALIHTDIGPQNAIQRPNGDIVLIDWDDVGLGPAVLDIGFPLIQQFIAGEDFFLEDNAAAFYGAYFSRRGMTREEKRLIFDAAAFISLDYLVYGDPARGFRRIKWAIANRSRIESVYLS